ncbi:family 16 glycosylhydrolase [Proteiniphilum sp. UBA5384]|uniref:family 16 glycosylhydrolase n=1 Tax=Proteiniphilum sp. UBA5384 TaxID=1947279 RepID=UPI0025EF2FC1|nr:family 16 glycosylhydrolase [Proteiniphilum sp. UBA5384]
MKKIILIISALLLVWVSCSDTEDFAGDPNKEVLITSVDLKDINDVSVLVSSDIDVDNNAITIIPKDDIDKRNLKFFATLSEGALSNPITGALLDFSTPVKFTVISESRGTIRDWLITVITKKEEALIVSIDDMKDKNDVSVLVASEIDTENKTVSILVKDRSDRENLKLSASISEAASIDPALDIITDFSLPVEYTVTSEDGKTVNKWVVDVTVEEFIDHDSGFDYQLDPSEWILDASKSDSFENWDEAKWYHYTGRSSSGDFDYEPENAFVADGKLRIVVDVNEERYSSGKIKSAFEIGENNYVKIRAKMVNYHAMVNSVILLQDGDLTPITFMETILGDADGFVSSLRQDGTQSIDAKATSVGVELHGDYHVYGLERRNEYLRFFFDGEVIWEFETAQYPDLSRQLLSLVIGADGKEGVKPVDTRLPAYLLVDYVEVYNAANTDGIVPSYGDNLVKNPGFESAQGNAAPESWTIMKNSGSTDVWVFRNWGTGGAQSGRFHFGKNSGTSTFDYAISQTINDLPDGLYRLEVQGYMLEGFTDFNPLPRLFAKGYGGEEKGSFIESEGPEFHNQSAWQKCVIDNIYVSNGSCEIGVQAVGDGQARLFIDDFSFVRVSY